LRVIAGTAHGKKLQALEGESTRPTTDRVKEAIFGSLQFSLQGAAILDLFAGSGALGIEALSRGAAFCMFVEQSRDAMRVVQANLLATGFEKKARCFCEPYDRALLKLSGSFDYVFLDPPYASGLYLPAIERILDGGLLSDGGVIVAEHAGPIEWPRIVCVIREKRYGKTVVTFLQRSSDAIGVSGEL